MESPPATKQIDSGNLKSITGHGALEIDGARFIRVRPSPMVHSFGPGVPTFDLIKDPNGSGGRTTTIS